MNLARSIVALACALMVSIAPVEAKARLFVLTDIGNEPDDQMSLVRLLLYSNEIDIEGLVATTSVWQRDKTSPDIIRKVIAAYGQVLPNLRLHAENWPSAESLSARVSVGQAGYGLAATGPGKLSDGAAALIKAADEKDSRPLWVALWGGANTLAQALDHVRRTRSPEDLAAFVSRLRVYTISDQDDAGPWIRREFPELFYIGTPSSPNGEEYGRATWTGISGDAFYRNGHGADMTRVTNDWLDRNIRAKGPLGAAYPRYMFIMEGDTPSFLNLIPNGLESATRPDWGGWGGRYVLRKPYGETRPMWTQGGDWFMRGTSSDTVNGVTSDQATIWRWRDAFQNDFAARMDWTIKPFSKANHPPVVVVDGSTSRTMKAGERIELTATKSHDPDGKQLTYRWFVFSEAGGGDGSNRASIQISASGPKAVVTAVSPCQPAWIDGLVPCKGGGTAHLILSVTDNGAPALTRYARFVIAVEPRSASDEGLH